MLSPFLTCEEAYLLAKLARDISPQARLYLGWVPVVGEDDRYPKDSKGNAVEPVKFTIRAEKCPNRRGVEAVLKHFQGEVLGFEQAVADRRAGHALYVTGRLSAAAGGAGTRLATWMLPRKVPLLVVQDLQASPAVERGQSTCCRRHRFAEKDGTFVNHANLAQAIRWAVRPGHRLRTDGQIFLDLLGRRGLLQAAAIRKELAREVPFFAPLAAGKLGEYGVRLLSARLRVSGRHGEPLTRKRGDGEQRCPTVLLIYTAINMLAIFAIVQGVCAMLIYVERKVAAWVQDRHGPNRVGPAGLLQSVADGLKFLIKEDVIPGHVNRFLFLARPASR